MTIKPSDPIIRTWARLMKAQHMALSAVDQALKAERLPQLAWYDVLLELERVDPRGLRPFELERKMLLAQYNLSRLVDRMEKAGHVKRRPCEDDGRGQIIVITPAGKELRQRMWIVYRTAIQNTIGDRLSTSETEALDSLLGTLIEKLTVE